VQWKERVACCLASWHVKKAGWEEVDLEVVSNPSALKYLENLPCL
jgi:hypothetical protein